MSVRAPHLTTVRVTGMTCEHCVRAVTEELTALDGVSTVRVDLADGTATVQSDHELSGADIAAAVDEAGYSVAD